MIDSPFRLPRKTPFGIGESVVEWATGLSTLDSLYQQDALPEDSFEFMQEALARIGTQYQIDHGSLDNVPTEGSVLIVANHPFGGIEGIILASLISQVRKDVKVLANELLKRIPELDELFIGVDVFGGEKARQTNRRAIKEANYHLKQGGVLIIFPAGEVSSWQASENKITDNTWSKSVAKFVKHAEATTVPLFIKGMNSKLFYQAGRIHPLLRTALLGRELLNKSGETISVSVGNPIPYSEIKDFDNEEDITQYFRLNTYLMGSMDNEQSANLEENYAEPIIAPLAVDTLEGELSNLAQYKLLEQGDFEVYCAPTPAMPGMMREIGRVREESFREVGEGSGQSCDIDRFDQHYYQLFVWNRANRDLVGAYRLGLVDQLIAQGGIDALYSTSLFNYDQAFVESLGQSIELGRSVVAKQYQRNMHSLLLLWKGIARFVDSNPKYTHLFGPVSISNDYSPVARQLIASVMSVHYYDNDKAKLVTPTTPLESSGKEFWRPDMLSSLSKLPLLSKVLSRLEQGMGLPVLLRQYLGMNGKLVCFNVDPAFNYALDGLIVVDLTTVPARTLGKYMGKEQAQAYLDKHH
ncbi:lysophospholipid acyltransferase family protein [Vibrio brasiliensis]|jgi:putative hemolysin|uniref:lysophospholipid acyltransferase family protein n=1 Tax=Vibrio brasiliensis TaxID=170652 RepID=UPI001EFD587A|nr:lysophospholipid acyltransferase family protein [Vibrio brasiliensis]MCG9753377.1 lysophospholipid acyltransferase family protein [Vibrio brasiliensis]